VGEKSPVILPKCLLTLYIQGSFTCRKATTWDRRLYFPSEGRCAEDFFALKVSRLRPGLNPRTWVPRASTLPLDHRSRLGTLVRNKMCICLYSRCKCLCRSGDETPLILDLCAKELLCSALLPSGKEPLIHLKREAEWAPRPFHTFCRG
jgi:hypothetical protein